MQNSGWAPMAAGTLRSLAERQRHGDLRRAADSSAGQWSALAGSLAGLAVAVAVLASVILGRPDPDSIGPDFAGVPCPVIHEKYPAYVAGTLVEPPAERFRAHVRYCPGCQNFLRKLPDLPDSLRQVIPPLPVAAAAGGWELTGRDLALLASR